MRMCVCRLLSMGQDMKLAATLLSALVAHGRHSARRWYGDLLVRGDPATRDLFTGMQLIQEACEWGDPFAMVDVGE